ncbi:hypothetical protein PVT01_000071100 [Plasmodium vivax]|uniref:Uncharacterized protein n=1 Tax=Plasmodium vivax TaxID=5855 RepID=A0A1G4E204_PLAVI|nr:hypothetical protein PVT01_000071100 [Plasmodium vivax]
MNLLLRFNQNLLQLHALFTPFRSLLSKITGRKKRQWENHMNELARNFSENYLNNGDSNNHDRMNNMFYQSIRN